MTPRSHSRMVCATVLGLALSFAMVPLQGSDADADVPGSTAAPPSPAMWAPHRPEGPQVGLQDPSTGRWYLWRPDQELMTFFYGNPGDIPFMGDWDCDGIDTPGLFRQSDAYAYLRNSNTQGVADIRFFFGNPSDVPLAGDFDGDGCDSLSIYRPSEQRFYVINRLGLNEGGLGAADYSFLFGNPGDKPVVGDWDGDGIDEVGLHRESTGFFYWRDSLDTGVATGQIYFGDPGDRLVAGDWGVLDGTDSPACYRPNDETFYFRYTLTQGVADSELVWPSIGADWLPVSGWFGWGPGTPCVTYHADRPTWYPPKLPGSGDMYGSGCTPGTDALPDGIWFGSLERRSATAVEFDLMCYFDQPGTGRPTFSNSNPKLRTVAVHPDAEVWRISDDGKWWFRTQYGVWLMLEPSPVCGSGCPVWMYVNGGYVTQVVEIAL